MKKVAILLLVSVLAACTNPAECVKSTGPMAVRSFDGLSFDKILVGKGIALVFAQGAESKVEIRSGENLIDDIKVSLHDGLLEIHDETDCNWVRDYGQTVAYITTPNLTTIYSKTELPIASNGRVNFPALTVKAMDTEDGFDGVGTGDIYLQVDCTHLSIESNNVARFFIGGLAQQFDLSVYEGGGVCYAQSLSAHNVQVYHRGTNDAYVNAIDAVSGNLYSVGSVYCSGHPPMVSVTAHYNGQFILL